MDRKDRPGGAQNHSSQKKGPAALRCLSGEVDFIDNFVSATDNLSSPEIFRRWGAISAIAGVLERKVWVRTMGSELYPNMYVVLVGSPGVGKSEVTSRIRALWQRIEGPVVASSSVTKASLMDELAQATRRIITNRPPEPVVSFNSMSLAVNELGVLLPAYENEFMNILTDLWDCKDYSERRRSRKDDPIDIKRAQLNMLAACTPSYLMHFLPEGAWDQGFISRTTLVFSGQLVKRSLFDTYATREEDMKMLFEHLSAISGYYGEIKFTEEAAALIDDFHLVTGDKTKPTHPKLASYNVRRTVHLLKLCMVSTTSRGNGLVIEEDDYHRALDWMVEVERYMPDIFKEMATGGTGKVMEEAWYHVHVLHQKSGDPVPEHKLIQFLQERVPVHQLKQTIDLMVDGKMLEKRLTKIGPCYLPKGKRG